MKFSSFLHDLTTATAIYDMDYNCFSTGQLQSKEWLIEVFDDVRRTKNIHLGTTFILCGWYGILAAMMFLKYQMDCKIRSFDIDPACEKIADQINKGYSSDNWRFKAITQNIYDINFEKHSWQCWSNKNNRMSYPIVDKPTIIINTACEHTDSKWFEKIPNGKIVILQSNDSFEEEGHINAVANLDDFTSMYPLSEIYYAGQLELEKFTRFMLIGVK